MSARMMIVEDERLISVELSGRLQRLGFEICATAASGSEALRLAAETRPDLVLMDIMLEGGMDGIQTAAALREAMDIPVIFLSAHTDQETLERAKITDPFGYLVKPYHDRELQTTIEIALYKHAMDKRLKSSEERYRSVFESSLAGIYRSLPEGRFEFVNPAMAHMLGYESPEELVGSVTNIECQLYVDPECRKRFLELLAATGEVLNMEFEVYGRDGQKLWVSQSATVVRDENGRIRHIDGAAVDITARKEAEAAYATTYELFRLTVDSIHDLVAVTDMDGNLIMTNRALRETFGLDGDALTAHTYQQLLPDADPAEERTHRTVVIPGHGRFSESVSPFNDASGRQIGFVHICRQEES